MSDTAFSLDDLQWSLHAARAAVLSYGGHFPQVRSQLERDGFDIVERYSKGDAQLTALRNDERLIIAFRGSEASLGDWIANLRSMRRVSSPVGRVGSGFRAVAEELLPMTSVLLERSTVPVILDGHSQGGAIAQYLGTLLDPRGEKSEIIDFGAPMVGGWEFSRNLARRGSHQRWVHQNDLVPSLPLSLIGRFLPPPDSLHYLSVSGEIWVTPSWLRVLWDRYRGPKRSWWSWASEGTIDHRMQFYLQRLETHWSYLTGEEA